MNETNGSEAETNSSGEDMSETNGSEERSFEIPGAIKLTIEDKFLSPEEVLALMHTHRPSAKNIPRGKRVPIEPQPAADAIIMFKQYYITLKRDPSYKRRISFLTQCPENMESMKNLAVVEYIGAFCQKPEPHGNSKKTTSECVRTSCTVKRKLEEMTETNKALAPRDIYEHMENLRDVKQFCTPTQISQIGTQISQIVIGSDEEVALLKAIKQCFPAAVQVLCTRHLEENVRRYLTNKVGLDDKSRKTIISKIFGKNRLILCNSSKNFELTYIKLLDKFHKRLPSFKDYFIKIAEKIRSGVFQARLNNKWIPIDWKNSSCESMNHIIKLSTNWTSMKLPALVDRLYRIVKLQQIDCRRALYGEGNYELAPWMKKLKVSNVHWKQKTEEEKEQVFKKFMKGLPERKQVISSTDGLLSVPRTPKIARKPGQRKRVKNIRT
ncbi:Hypothetical predicted protein [Paramuricea clavata]|uniref:Uncharacterized protein n=1 Tax=Paramuricea clavata TaxID=317549 RepID=A0A7D9D7D2_PARCT|nr:Hypothetical predicted protein [Paramuricea clavata]